ncbi:2951_t:CDS:2, partial [Paraglomus occultum]
MKAIRNLNLDNVRNDLRRNLTQVNPLVSADMKHLSHSIAVERNVWNNLNNLALEQNEAAKSLA